MELDRNFEYLLYLLLRRTTQAVGKVREKELNASGTNSRKAGVFSAILLLGEDVTLAKIAKLLFLESHSISEQIKRMEKDGLVKKEKDVKNIVRISITDKGYEMYLTTEIQESIDVIMSVLKKREKIQLWRILSKMRDKAVNELGITNPDLFPPSEYTDAKS